MVVKVTKPGINVREKINELDKPSGIAGEAMLRAETPQEQFNLISAGRRNIIVNGAMKVAQRGTSASSVGTGVIAATDRMKVYRNNSVVYTVSQSTDAPAGFTYSHKVVSTTGDGSLGSGDLNCPLLYKIEGQDLQHLGYGTTDSKHSTVSFWVKTNVTGTYSISFYKTNVSSRVYVPLYTVSKANTWQYVSLTIPPESVPHANDASNGLDMYFNVMAGSGYTSQPTTNWSAYTTNNWAGGHTARCFASNNDSWQITGLQYEVGKVATPFEHRSFNEDLALCQRYYCEFNNLPSSFLRNVGYGGGGTTGGMVWQFPVTMRATPTGSFTNGQAFYANNGAAASVITSMNSATGSATSIDTNVTFGSSYTGKGLSYYTSSFSAKTSFNFDAEM